MDSRLQNHRLPNLGTSYRILIEETLNALEPTSLGFRALEESLMSVNSSMSAMVNIQRNLVNASYREMGMVLTSVQNELTRTISEYSATVRSLGLSVAANNIIVETQKWTRILETCKAPIAQDAVSALVSTARGIGTMVDMMDFSGLFAEKPLLSARLLEPGLYSSSFNRATIARLNRCYDDRTRSALKASIRAAVDDGFQTALNIARVLDIPEGPDTERPTVRMNTAHLRRQELERSSVIIPWDADLDYIHDVTMAGRLARQTQRMLDLIRQCNQAATLKGRDKIFETTEKMLEGFACLPSITITSKERLTYVVGMLYCMLYEGAGTDRLRFKDRSLLSDEDCRVIWAIKHLRNKYLLHDIEHGSPSDVRKSWRVLHESLEWLGIDRLPQRKHDFIVLQEGLIREIIQMLELLLGKINALPVSEPQILG